MNNKVFDKKVSSKSLKYFIIAFAVMLLILSVVSVFLFMRSIDYNFDNLTGETTQETETLAEIYAEKFYVSSLTGKSKILFVCESNDDALNFACVIDTDFEQGYIKVKSYDKDDEFLGKKLFSYYEEKSVDGLKEAFGFNIDKYVICNQKQLQDILSLFENIYISVNSPVDYRSQDFNLQLKEGKQILSDDYIAKYLIVSDNATRSQIMCDILNSILVAEYTENSQKLFTAFVNNCETDISVIDYSEKIDELIIYSKAEDKFLVSVG